jgi:hypothetical protein
MTRYRIETFCKVTGEPQAAEVLDCPMEVLIFCGTPWRFESMHVVYRVHDRGEDIFRIYVAGRNVTPHLK